MKRIRVLLVSCWPSDDAGSLASVFCAPMLNWAPSLRWETYLILRCIWDRKVAKRELISFNAGTHRDLIQMRVEDFCELVRPLIGNFGEFMEPITVAAF